MLRRTSTRATFAAMPKRRGRPPLYAVSATGPRIVKKYGNRRLYDTRQSRYINLDELMDLFAAEGEEPLRVVDAATGADLAERTLRQALLAESSARALVPAPLLRALLRYRRGRRRIAFERHLTLALAAFQRHAG